ncbi:MAG: C10 family peptidase [Desulfamplus sp.]|nr:C10 family peptidase [Desulfamplus sp.]
MRYYSKSGRVHSGHFFVLFFLAVIFVSTELVRHGYAAQIDQFKAEEVAQNFITYLDEHYTIGETEMLEELGLIIGYLINLNPEGYIIISGDTIRVPVKAYSLSSNFANLPPAYVGLLLKELKVDSSAKSALSRKFPTKVPEEINRPYWEFLTLSNIVSRKNLRSYSPDTFLLTTKWNQGYPYNKFNPKVNDQLTVAGCVQTAAAQVMRYHAHPSSGTGVFHHTWNRRNFTAVMNRPFNWDAMPDVVDGSVPGYQQDEVAALMRDLGVLNEANFGTEGTSAYFHCTEFERAFGYAPVAQMDSNNQDFFATIKNEIDNQRPLLLAIPGHMTVADGYASDPSGKKIHINLGWGGSHDDYYYLDETIETDQHTFEPNHTIYYNIMPCQGSGCDPYTPTTYGNDPVIGSYQDGGLISAPDDITMEINASRTIRIESYDLDGDGVTLSASASSNTLQTALTGNLLTLTPTQSNIFCNVDLKAQSVDGTAEKTFKVLVLDEMVYAGNNYDIGGEFADGTEIDQYKVYLGGDTTISGDRGYSNGQCFYTWIEDGYGNRVVDVTDLTVSRFFDSGIYTLYASLRYTYPGGGYTYYNYDPDYSGYTLTVISDSSDVTVLNLAETMGIELSDESSGFEEPVFQILTDSSSYKVMSGYTATVYGSSGPNNVVVERGASARLINFIDDNEIKIESDYRSFEVSRSGATVTFTDSSGTVLTIPATTSSQTIIFDDKTLQLVIRNSQVMLGSQVIHLQWKN